jgi:transposase
MANWLIKAGKALKPLDSLLKDDLKAGVVQRHDETRVQVMGEEGRENKKKSWMWLCRGGPPDKPVLRYKYSTTRGSENILEYVEGYSGFLQSDGYDGYDCAIKKHPGIIHVGCFAHARRKFVEAEKNSVDKKSAAIAIKYISNLYAIEGNLRDELNAKAITPVKFMSERAKQSVPILEKFKKWLDTHINAILNKAPEARSLLEKAIYYSWNQWDKLEAYLSSVSLTPDNNLSENAIRPFVIGRKNWLFFNCPEGAESGCLFYSLIETAKANGLNPLAYLTKVIQLAPVTTDWSTLLPWNINKLTGQN